MSESNGVLRVKLVQARKPVVIEGPDGKEVEYYLEEMLSDAKGEWQTAMAGRMRVDGSGRPVGVRDYRGMEASLVARCLHDPVGGAVPEGVIAKWPTSVITMLFEECRRLNALETDEERTKKD